MAQEGGQSTATALAEQLTRNPNTLSTILDRMERGGLVKKERDTVDRRLVRVTMTPEGKKKLAECVQVGWKVIEKLTARFSDDELKDAVRLITKLKDAAAEELAADKSAPDPEAEPVEA
jgi:DNA-binding MarR family transcriptional regulator